MTESVAPVVIRQPARIPFDQFADAGQPRAITEAAPFFRRLPAEGAGLEDYRFGVWETSSGTWRREDPKAEFCHILAGEGTFTADGGEVQSFHAGDTLFFPRNTRGIWVARSSVRKVFVVMPE